MSKYRGITTQTSIALLGSFLLVLSTAIPHATAQLCTPAPEGIIAWWPGDTDANDISGNANHAQLQGDAQAGIAGKVDGAFQFDGAGDVATTPVLLPQQGTIELWLNAASLSVVHSIIGTFGLANGSDRLWITAQGPGGGFIPNTLRVNLGNNAVDDIVIPNPLVVGTWTHLALTFDYTADQYLLYLDGQEVASFTADRNAPTQVVRFGGVSSDFGQTFFFDGLLDEVTIYNRVLTPNEIQAIVQADSAGKCSDTADLDGDGVLDDLCPTSDVRPTVALDSCDSGVSNPVLPSGCTLGDLLADCTVENRPRRVIQCVKQLTNKLERLSILTEEQQAAIIACAKQTVLP